MAEWKKVIVSGSNAHLKHITSSGNFSASGNLFGELSENTQLTRVVVYNPATGQLEQKELNLVQTIRAPRLFMADFDDSSNASTTRFKLSFDSSSNTSEPITAPFLISASYVTDEFASPPTCSNAEFLINGAWDDVVITDQVYFDQVGPTNITGSVNDARNGLITGTSKEDIILHLNTIREFIPAAQESDKTNDPVPAHDPNAATKNYLINAFDVPPGAATDTASILVYVNDNLTPKAEFSLTGSGNPAISTEVNNITPALFASASNLSNFGDLDTTKSNRSGSITIGQTHQVDGYNYAFVVHSGSQAGTQFAHMTNFVEWFYDNNGAGQGMVATEEIGSGTEPITSSSLGTYSISGIKYFKSGFGLQRIRKFDCTNQYRNIYSRTGGIRLGTSTTDTALKFSVTQSGELLTSTKETAVNNPDGSDDVDLQSLQSVTNAHLQKTKVTASFEFDPGNSSINGVHFPSDFNDNSTGSGIPNYRGGNTVADCQGSIQFIHVNKTNTTAIGATYNDFLMCTEASASSTEAEHEQFRGERFRVKDRTYSVGDDPTSHAWDGTQNIGDNGAAEYRDGLLIFNSHLVYPTNAGVSSDDGSFATTLGPEQSFDYSSGATQAVSGERNYYRYFRVNSSQAGNKSLSLEFKGEARVRRSTITLADDDIHIFFQRLGINGDTVLNNGITANSLYSSMQDVTENTRRIGNNLVGSDAHIPLTNNVSNISYSGTNIYGISVPTSVVSFGEAASAPAFATNEYVLVKIVCPASWKGYIDAMSLAIRSVQATNSSILDAQFSNTSA